jgi:hypothetical protein
LRGGIRSPEVCNQLPVQYDRVVVVHGGHPVAMHACGDWGLVHKGDLGGPKCFEHVDHLNNAGVDGLASNPGLVLLAVHPTLLDDAEANVDDVNIVHPEAHAAGVLSSGEEAKDEGIESVGGVPIGGHALPVRLVILGRCLTVLVDKPEEEVNEDKLGLQRHHCWKEMCTWDDMA